MLSTSGPADALHLYETVCKDLSWTKDIKQASDMAEHNKKRLAELDAALKDAEENLGDIEVRDQLRARADFLSSTASRDEAAEAYDLTEKKTAGAGPKLDLAFSLLRSPVPTNPALANPGLFLAVRDVTSSAAQKGQSRSSTRNLWHVPPSTGINIEGSGLLLHYVLCSDCRSKGSAILTLDRKIARRKLPPFRILGDLDFPFAHQYRFPYPVSALCRMDIAAGDWRKVSAGLEKAEALVADGGDWERKNRLKVYKALFRLATRDFKQAAELFLDSIATFTS